MEDTTLIASTHVASAHDTTEYPEKFDISGPQIKDINKSYYRRAAEDPDRKRKNGKPVYNISLKQMETSGPGRKTHMGMYDALRFETRASHTGSRRTHVLEHNDFKEQQSIALNKSVELPSERVQKREIETAAVARAVGGLESHMNLNTVPSELREKAAVSDLCKADDTTVDRSPEFNLNFIPSRGIEFKITPAKKSKKGRKVVVRKAQATNGTGPTNGIESAQDAESVDGEWEVVENADDSVTPPTQTNSWSTSLLGSWFRS